MPIAISCIFPARIRSEAEGYKEALGGVGNRRNRFSGRFSLKNAQKNKNNFGNNSIVTIDSITDTISEGKEEREVCYGSKLNEELYRNTGA